MTLAVVLSLAVLGASAYDQTFEQANAAYESGDYVAAVDDYERIVAEDIVHPAVFYNLGNAYYRSGRLGAAVANYERCLALAPGFDSAAENLDQCVRETKRGLVRPGPPEWERSLLFWHYNLRPRTTRIFAAAFWIALWVVLGIRQVRSAPFTRVLAVLLAVLAVAFGASAWAKAHPPTLAVASQDQVPVYYATDESSTVRFVLYDGDRVLVDRRADGWARLATNTGERGWAREAGLTFVGPPYERAPDRQKLAMDDQENAL